MCHYNDTDTEVSLHVVQCTLFCSTCIFLDICIDWIFNSNFDNVLVLTTFTFYYYWELFTFEQVAKHFQYKFVLSERIKIQCSSTQYS